MREADVCILVEGGYPFLLGGVSSWTHSFIRAYPDLTFHVAAFFTSAQERKLKFALPDNVLSVQEVLIDRPKVGRVPRDKDAEQISRISGFITSVMTEGGLEFFAAFLREVRKSGLAAGALADSRYAWSAMERAYALTMPDAPIVDFYWSWRFLVDGLLSIATTPLPPARLYHAVSTGYPGMLGARAKIETGRPFVITEHGIYTNERRIEIAVADWLYAAESRGYAAGDRVPELHDLWMKAFVQMSRLSYEAADLIVTQYRDNQNFQRKDGAPEEKLRLIPNGIDIDAYANVPQDPTPRRPTAALIGRVVPIKDSRTFVLAGAALRKKVPDARMLLIGPEDEDPQYAAECKGIVKDLGLENTVEFLGRVPDVKEWFGKIDVLALTSISEAQPLALLEAGCAGVPAVTTDVGSCREILEGLPADGVPGRCGFVVPSCDPDAVAEALAEILLNPAMRASMSDVFRKRVVSYYGKPRIDRAYRELYDSLFPPEGKRP